MGLLVDTNTVPPRERFEFWQSVAAQVFMPVEIRPSSRWAFSGRIAGYALGDVNVFRSQADPSLVMRSRYAIRAGDPELFHFAIHLRGNTMVEQGDRATFLRVGDLTTLDTSQPFTIKNCGPFEWLLFSFPRALLGPYVDEACRQTATRIPGIRGLGQLVSPFIHQLDHGLEDGTVLEGDAGLGESVLTLVRTLCARRPRRRGLQHVGHAALRLQVKAYIDANLGDPGLSRNEIARAHFISTRQLNRLFEPEGRSVSEIIRERRLEGCRTDLADPVRSNETAFSIALRWGFRNQAHFSRAFRTAYGCSPRAYRQEAAQEARAGIVSAPAPS
jgi:AraC-like DNA-binding protein